MVHIKIFLKISIAYKSIEGVEQSADDFVARLIMNHNIKMNYLHHCGACGRDPGSNISQERIFY